MRVNYLIDGLFSKTNEDRQIDGQTVREINKWADRLNHRFIYTHAHTDMHTHTQICTHTHIHTCTHTHA